MFLFEIFYVVNILTTDVFSFKFQNCSSSLHGMGFTLMMVSIRQAIRYIVSQLTLGAFSVETSTLVACRKLAETGGVVLLHLSLIHI